MDETLERPGATISGEPVGAPPEDLVGRTLLHFRVDERLGAGGMGVVYRAFDTKLERTVAIKVLNARYVADERNRESILREARSAAALTHPNIAAIYEVHDTFLVMEHVTGTTLRARGRMPLADALRCAREVARALACAHAAGVVHRDLKADNVMVTPAGDIKLLDFGLAKPVGADTDGRVEGTPAYMSPEQARGEPVDARTDVFAFGVLVHELVAGDVPFGRDGTPSSWSDRPTHWTPRARLRAPRAVEQLVHRCLAYDREARFADGAALVAAVDAAARKRRRAWLAVPVAALALGEAWWMRGDRDELEEPGPLLAIAAVPPSRSTNAEAIAAYRRGMDAIAHGSLSRALHELDDALARDSDLASALLQRACLTSTLAVPLDDVTRRQFARATALATTLTNRDRELVDAVAPAFADPPDWAGAAERLAAMGERRPADAEVYALLGMYLTKLSRFPQALHAFDRSDAADPTSIFNMQVRADLEMGTGHSPDATATLDRCTARAPREMACRTLRATWAAATGDCATEDRIGREMVALEPAAADGYFYRTAALATLGAEPETLSELIERGDALIADPAGRAMQLASDRTLLAMMVGDFSAAQQHAEELAGLTNGNLETLLGARLASAAVLHQSGDDDTARAQLVDTLHRIDAFPTPEQAFLDRTINVIVVAHRYGAISDAEFARRRDAWVSGWRTRLTSAWANSSATVWAMAYANASTTATEAREALAMRDFGPLPPSHDLDTGTGVDLSIGVVLQLAGRLPEAAEWLTIAARACALDPWIRVNAYAHLGEVREAQGDRVAACTAYGEVLARWGHAKPRSVLADDIRERATKLGCP